MNTITKRLWPYLFLLCPIIIFFSPVLFQNKLPIPADTIPGLYHPMRDTLKSEYPNGPPYKNFLITDAVRQQYPWRQFSINQLKQGHIPWWNPYNFSGTPHLANFQSATFYPLNVIFWFTNFTTGWSLLVISQPILGSLFLYWYLRNIKLKKIASIFGSLTWIFSGFFVAWLEWNTAVHVAIWTPLILLSIDTLLSKNDPGIKTRSWYVILFCSLIAQALAGYPQPWIYLSLLQICYLGWRVTQNKNVKASVKLGVVYLLFLITISPQLLTTHQFSQLSNRLYDQGDLFAKPDWFLPYQNLIQLIIPDFFGNPATLNYWGVFNYTEFVSFIGIFSAILITNLIFTPNRRKESSFFILFAFLSLVFATKNFLSEWQFKLHLPFLSNSQPSRWLVITDLCLPVLAAFSLDHFLNHKPRAKTIFTSILVIGSLLAASWLVCLKPSLFCLSSLATELHISQRNLILPTVELIIISLTILLGWLFCDSPFSHKISRFFPRAVYQKHTFVLMLIIVSTATSLRFARKFTPFSNPQFLYPQSTILSYLQDNADLYRYMTTDRRLMAPNFNLAYNLYTIEGYDPLYLSDYGRFIYATELDHYPDASKPFNRIVTTDNFTSPLINILGVKYVLSLNFIDNDQFTLIMEEGDTKLYQNQQVLPRAFITQSTDIFDLNNYHPVTITSYQPHHITLSTSVTPTGTLILTDAYYPDWQASLNGQPVKIRNWYGLRAIDIPAGTHQIVFCYQPFSKYVR